MEQIDCKSDSSDSSIDLDEPANVTSTAGTATYIPGASLSDKLRLAASKGQTDRLKALVSLGASFDPDREGRTALHYAAVNGFADTVFCLIAMGCDIDAKDKCLYHARYLLVAHQTQAIIRSGIFFQTVQLGYTAMHRAAAQGHLEVIKVLTEQGCWIDSQDEANGNTALHEASWNGYSQTLQILIMRGAEVQLVNKAGFSALHMAAQNGHNNCARILLYAGCNPLNKNNYGDTALHTAARYGHAGIARILISARCNINDQNKNADTALHIAAALKRRKITKLLVEAGIMTTIQNRQGETALDVAQRKDLTEIVQLLTSMTKYKQQQQQPPEMNWMQQDNGGVKPSHPPVMPVVSEVPQVVADEEGKKKKRGFFFKKKKKTKDKDRSADSGSIDAAPAVLPAGAIPQKMTSQLPSPEELMQGFQKHQAQKLQVASHWPLAPSGHCPVSNYDAARAGIQCYMDLAGNIRQGPSGYGPACSCPHPMDQLNKDRPVNPGLVGMMISDQIEAANRRLLQQATATDVERQCQDRNFHFDEVTSLEQRVRKQFNMQKGLANGQPLQRFDHRLATHVCYCEWCQGQTIGQPYCRGDDIMNHHRGKGVPETPPPGKMYKSKSDETLSTISSHANRRHWQMGPKEQGNPDARLKHHHRRPRERRDKRQEAGKKVEAANGRSVQARTPDLYLNDKELHNDSVPLVVPANVRQWLIKQGELDKNTRLTNPNKIKYTEVYDL